MEIKISELRLVPISKAGASVHARNDYPVKPGPLIVAAGLDGNHYVVGNVGKFLAQKKKSVNGTIDAELMDLPPDDPRIAKTVGLDLFDAPMSADEAKEIIAHWGNNCKKAARSGIIASESEWPHPNGYGLIPQLFEAYLEGKLKSAQARIIQKLPHDAQELIEAGNNLKLPLAVFEALLETYNTEGMETFKALLDNPAKINDIAISERKEITTAPAESSLPPPAEDEPDDIDLKTINVTPEMHEQLKEEEEHVRDAINIHLYAWKSLGRALRSIYRNNLYAAKDYANFGRYCKDTFGIHPSRAYELVRCYSLYLELKRTQPDQSEDIKIAWTQIRLLQSLPENHKESLVLRNCVFLKDGTRLTLEDFLNMTTKEQNAVIEELKSNLSSAQRKLIETERKHKEEIEEKIKEHEFLQGELQAEINSLNRKIMDTSKQIALVQSAVKEKDDLIKDMATKAHEQQQVGAQQERKKIEKDILKFNSQIDSLKQTEKKLQKDLSMMTRLHAESIEEQKKLLRLAPEQIADMEARQAVYQWAITSRHWEETHTKALLDKIADNYDAHKDQILMDRKATMLNVMKQKRDDTLAYTAHWLACHAKNVIAFYALKEEHIPMDKESSLRYNALIEELETILKLLQAAKDWWQDSSGLDFDSYHKTVAESARPTALSHRIPKTELPLEVDDFLKSLNI